MHEKAVDFLIPVGPTASATPANGTIFNIALAAAANTPTDLSGANYAGLYAAIGNGCYVTLTATVDLWYRWDSATGTVDETKTAASTPANQGIFLPAGASVREQAPIVGGQVAKWLIAKATPTAGTLCIQISSRSAQSRIFGGVTTT